jgi:hypothetical protein
LRYNSALLISELPEDGCTEEVIKKVFQPFGKVNDVLIVPYRKEVSYSVYYKDKCKGFTLLILQTVCVSVLYYSELHI